MRVLRCSLLLLVLLLVGCASRQEALDTRRSFKEIDKGMRMLVKGDKSHALKTFDKAIADSPSNKDLRLLVIGLLTQEGMYRESIPRIERAIAIPDRKGDFLRDSALYTTLGDARWKLGDHDGAQKAYQEAIRLNKYNATAYNNWGYMLAESNQQLDKALGLTRKALALEPENGYFLDSVGWAYFQKGEPAKAIENLRKAAARCPKEVEVRLHYAEALQAAGENKSALIEYHKIHKLSPSNLAVKERIRTLRQRNTNQ